MRWSSITGRESANRACRAAGSAGNPARNGTRPLRAAVAAFTVALFVTAGLPAAPIGELLGVWVLDRAGGAAEESATARAEGDLAIWQTGTGIGLTWSRLPPDPIRRSFEFARGAAGDRLELVSSDPPPAPGERVGARLGPDRLVIDIARTSGGVEQTEFYALFVHHGRLVFEYRLRQGPTTLESATRQLRRIKVVM